MKKIIGLLILFSLATSISPSFVSAKGGSYVTPEVYTAIPQEIMKSAKCIGTSCTFKYLVSQKTTGLLEIINVTTGDVNYFANFNDYTYHTMSIDLEPGVYSWRAVADDAKQRTRHFTRPSILIVK